MSRWQHSKESPIEVMEEKQRTWRVRQDRLAVDELERTIQNEPSALPTWYVIVCYLARAIRVVGFGVGAAVAIGSLLFGPPPSFIFFAFSNLPGLWLGSLIGIVALLVSLFLVEIPATWLLGKTEKLSTERGELQGWESRNPIQDPFYLWDLKRTQSLEYRIPGIGYIPWVGHERPILDPGSAFEMKQFEFKCMAREIRILRAARYGGYVDSEAADKALRARFNADTARDKAWEESKLEEVERDQIVWEYWQQKYRDLDEKPPLG